MPGPFCMPTGTADLENARRTVQAYLISVQYDPSVVAYEAPWGTIALGIGADPLVAGKLWQKQDDGCTTNWSQLVTVNEVIGLIGQLGFKDPARLATDADHILSGLADIDGVTPVAGDRILVKAQTLPEQNGIYIAAAGAWTRAVDFDEDAEVKAGVLVPVTEGLVNEDTIWILATNNPIVVGVTALTFAPFGGATFEGIAGWPVVGPVVYDDDVDTKIKAAEAAAVTTPVAGGAGALAAAVGAAGDGDVIEVTDSLDYDPFTIPAAKGLVIRAQAGQTPRMTGLETVKLANGARDLVMMGFEFFNTTSSEANSRGSAVTLEHQAIVSGIIFYNCSFRDSLSASSVCLGYHQTLGGDNYTDTYLDAERSENIVFVSCRFLRANKNTSELAAICMRGVKSPIIRGCRFDAEGTDGRATNIMCSSEILIEDCLSVGSSGYEAYKFDKIGAQTLINDGVIRRCIADGADEGFDNDDMSEVEIEKCIARNCTTGFVSVKSTGSLMCNTCLAHACTTGFRALTAVPALKKALVNCLADQCTTKASLGSNFVLPLDVLAQSARNSLRPLLRDRTGLSLYVSKSKEIKDDLTPNGSFDAPFRTIQAAINEVVNRGGIGMIEIARDTYAEVIDVSSPALISLSINGNGSSVGTGGVAMVGNNLPATFSTFYVKSLNFLGTVTLFSIVNPGTTFSYDCGFTDCVFTQKVTAKNLIVFDLVTCKVNTNMELENIFLGYMTDEPGMGPFQFDLNTIPANPKPAAWANGVGSVFIISGTVFLATTVNISDDSELQIRNGVRYSNPGGVSTVGTALATARLTIYNSWLWAGNVTGTGTLTLNGSLFDSGVTNIAGMATVNRGNDPFALRYNAANPANWAPPVPVDLLTAIQRLEQQVQILTGGPIP